MRSASEILEEELSENMLKKLKEIPLMKEWVEDAIYSYAKEMQEEINNLFNIE